MNFYLKYIHMQYGSTAVGGSKYNWFIFGYFCRLNNGIFLWHSSWEMKWKLCQLTFPFTYCFFICIFSSLFVNLIFFESSNYAARCIFSHLISPTSKRSEVLMKIFRYSHSTRVSFTASAAVPAESLIYVALRIRSVAPCGRQTDKRSIRKLARLCARQTNVQLYRKGI